MYNTTLGSIAIIPTGMESINGRYTLNYSQYYGIDNYTLYNLTVKIYIHNPIPIIGNGIRIGLQWLNSSGGKVRTDWSDYHNSTISQWFSLNVIGVCNNETDNEIEDPEFILSGEGLIDNAPEMGIYFDDLRLDKWIAVNITDPTNLPPSPPATKANYDGFPAQVLQVYWILKDHRYTDDNIFLMLYYKNYSDGIIDIDKLNVIQTI